MEPSELYADRVRLMTTRCIVSSAVLSYNLFADDPVRRERNEASVQVFDPGAQGNRLWSD